MQENNLPQVFTYEGTDVRVVLIDGEPWFVASDVCGILELNTSLAVNGQWRRGRSGERYKSGGLDDDEKGIHIVNTPGGPQEMLLVSEPGLYALILKSRKPEAKNFKRWVTHEVVPSIRKTGQYLALGRMPTHIEALRGWADALEQLEASQAEVAQLAPPAASWNNLVAAPGDFSLREAAQILSRKTGVRIGQNRLTTLLKDWGWIDRNREPYQKQVEAGRLARKINPYEHPYTGEQRVSVTPRVTMKGIDEIHRRLAPPPHLTVV